LPQLALRGIVRAAWYGNRTQAGLRMIFGGRM